ncbi:hypothetical protein CC2G_006807 [Coprinopsis cinerea AmutBmut pab1-1]|nr:hypothetical protein CC2G_006807 [Coprinopsis cinerea AmutBmut pab1-1]
MAGAWSPGGKMNFYGDYTERFKRWFARTGTDASLDLSLDLHAGEADPMNLAEWIHDLRTRWRVLEIKHPFNFDYPDVSNRSIGQWSQLSSLTFPFKNFRNSSRLPPAHYKIYPLLSQMPVLRSLDLDLTHLDAGEELAFLSPVAVQRQVRSLSLSLMGSRVCHSAVTELISAFPVSLGSPSFRTTTSHSGGGTTLQGSSYQPFSFSACNTHPACCVFWARWSLPCSKS